MRGIHTEFHLAADGTTRIEPFRLVTTLLDHQPLELGGRSRRTL